jgi:parvulin-like peptidyl-prolyl isomerase
VTRAEFDRNWEYFLQRSGVPAVTPTRRKVKELRSRLDRLVDEVLFRRRKLRSRRQDAVTPRSKARGQFPSRRRSRRLSQNKLTEAGLRAVFSRNLSIQSFVENVVAKGVAISDAEVHDFYTGNKDKFESPEQARARHILVAVDDKADEKTRQAAKAEAEELLVQLKGGANFEELAKKSSDCPSAPPGRRPRLLRHGRWCRSSTRLPSPLPSGASSFDCPNNTRGEEGCWLVGSRC